jgi:phosphate:Na+ symporter
LKYLLGYFLFILFFLSNFQFAQAEEYILKKPVSNEISNYCGDNQKQQTGTKLKLPVRLQVLKSNGSPAAGVSVFFEILSIPDKGDDFHLSDKTLLTDSTGIVTLWVNLGSSPGEYTIIGGLKNFPSEQFLIYRFTAKEKNWVFMLIIGLLGGLGLFLLGMHMMSEGMQKSAGDRMRSILGSLTKNRFMGLGVGTFVTMVIQSSSATTVMMVSFVNSGLISFRQTLGVILGAAIGTTITAQLIAFKLTDYALLLVAAGFALNSFVKNEKLRQTGETILGFGILFYGMHIMSESMIPLRTFSPFIDFIVRLENPFIGILIGTLFTALIQSSSAFIGIMIVLASQGLLSLEASIPLLMGANVGTAITAILASIGTNRDAKRVAFAHTFFKLFGVLILIWFIPEFVKLVEVISPKATGPDQMVLTSKILPRQIANAHTIFNVVITLILLPFLNSFARIITWILPDKPETAPTLLKTKYIEDGQNLPSSLGLSLTKEEVIHMAHIVQDMVNNFISPFILKENPDLEWMDGKEEEVDFLRDRINAYLLGITSGNLEKSRTNEAFEIMYTIKELEQIADIISDNYKDKAVEWCKTKTEFTPEGKKELTDYHLQVIKQISRAIEVFREINLEKAYHMKAKHRKYRTYAMELEKSHYQRLVKSVENSIATSEMHLELLSLLETIYSHATNIARIILQWSENNNNFEENEEN